LALGLRTPAGVPSDTLPDDLDGAGLVERSDGRAVLTVRGRLMADAVTTRLMTEASTGADDVEPTGTIPPYA
jgi:ribosomal protein S19E (S16A)